MTFASRVTLVQIVKKTMTLRKKNERVHCKKKKTNMSIMTRKVKILTT